MIFRELSNAVFRFVLQCAGAELDGGVFKHPPPPQQVVENPEAPSGRGLMGTGSSRMLDDRDDSQDYRVVLEINLLGWPENASFIVTG